MRTAGMIQAGTPNPDGHIFIPATRFSVVGGAATVARAAKGLVSLNIAASQAAVLSAPIGEILFRYGAQDYLQEQWGSTANGGAQGLPTPPAVFTTPAPLLQNPPFTGSSQLVPPNSRPTGISFKNLNPVFSIAAVAATLNTLGLSKTQFAAGVAPVVTDILAPTAIGVAVAANQAPVVPVNVNPNVFQVSRLAEYILEWQLTTPAGSSASLYGVFMDVVYNYN